MIESENDNLNIQQESNLMTEKIINAKSGCMVLFLVLFLLPIVLTFCVSCLISLIDNTSTVTIFLIVIVMVTTIFTSIFIIKGFFVNGIKSAHVLTLFGKYYGTVKQNGYLWVNPF